MKTKIWILFIGVLLTTSLMIFETYALFETNATTSVDVEVGKWVIKINDTLISNSNFSTFTINSLVFEDNDNVQAGYIAPGVSGYYDIVLDSSDTDVDVRYDITFDLSEELASNVISNVEVISGSSLLKSENNTYTGLIHYFEEDNVVIRLSITWLDQEETNEQDTELGIQTGNKFSIPVYVKVAQYLGEEIN